MSTHLARHNHPLEVIREIRRLHGDDLMLTFSRYLYRPQTILDQREVFSVSITEVTGDWFRRQSQQLEHGWELALNSKVRDARRRTNHIPMIDFSPSKINARHFDLMREILGRSVFQTLSLFSSGRSFHGYTSQLLTPSQWQDFMGRLLLLNEPTKEPLVDARWIGHRLISGYAALRWTANSSHYAGAPTRINLS
ncbi:primase 1D-like protein [Solimonas sp. K1W22B-7]|uniref:primase 1D-like protein n=1 Tax=Solimonas sp. K1W22B-7 TaxID=2303331 RepID=UPI0013C48F6D|nr:hypothetical protein [Solimonas sp. K1W22B-7]